MEELLASVGESGTEKGENGYVGIVAGSVEFAGQPALVGEASLRTGTDVTEVLTSQTVVNAVSSYSPNLLVKRYTGEHLSTDSVSKAHSLADWSDVLVIGPGLASPDREAIRRIVAEADVPLVVDADAIAPAVEADVSDAVFTPDSHEVDQIEAVHGSVEAFVEETGSVVVSTGSEDTVTWPGGDWRNDTGTPAMTVAGTGDILAGIVGSLLGQGADRVDAARLGVWLIGKAGERATEEYGVGVVATDIIDCIPKVLLEAGADGGA